MKIIQILIALLMVMLLVPFVVALLPFVGAWFAAAYCLLVILGYLQSNLDEFNYRKKYNV